MVKILVVFLIFVEWEEEKAEEEEEEIPMLTTGFQQNSHSFESTPPSIRTSPSFNIPFATSLKTLSRSILSYTRSKSDVDDPKFSLTPIDKRKASFQTSLPEDEPHQHHHPGERPGLDAGQMINDTLKDDGMPTNFEEGVSGVNI